MIKLNLSKGSLNNYHIGNNLLSHQKCFKEGFAVYSTSGIISSILICLQDGYEGFSVFKGQVLFNDIVLDITIDNNLGYFSGLFGEPYELWCDEVEQCAQYFIGKFQVEIIWNVENQSALTYLSISSDL